MASHKTVLQPARFLRESKTTQRRFALLVGVLSVCLVSAVVAERYLAVRAGATTVVSGRVYNATTGKGYGNVTVYLCNSNGTAATDANGYFSKPVVQGAGYCARVSSFPFSMDGLSGPRAVNNSAVIGGGQPSYEYQVAGTNCFQNASCSASQQRWDRNFAAGNADTGYDFVYTGYSKTATLTVTSSTQAKVAAGSDKAAPSVPGNFQAAVSSSNNLVMLQWTPSTDNAGVKGYTIERSLDENAWTSVAMNVTGTTYTDAKVDYSVHYFYRIKAIDQAGNASAYATTDAMTGGFTSSNQASASDLTVSSGDGVAAVEIPSDAYQGDMNCSVTLVTGHGAENIGDSVNPLAAGPYQLDCRTISSQPVTSFLTPIHWTYDLKGKLNGLNNPVAFSYTTTRKAVSSQTYDATAGILKFDMATGDETFVLGAKVQGISLDIVVLLLVVILVVIGLGVLIARKKEKTSYDDYLRRKYYNL